MNAFLYIREVNKDIICLVKFWIIIFLTYIDKYDKYSGKSIITEMKMNISEIITEDYEIVENDKGSILSNNVKVKIDTL